MFLKIRVGAEWPKELAKLRNWIKKAI
jgi:hypothetical protein